MRHAGNRFLDPVPFSNPTFTARDPYTATLGIPISTKLRCSVEGTGGLFLSAGGDDKDIYLMTARHVVLPAHIDDNKEYYHQNNSKRSEEVIILGDNSFAHKLAAIDYQIRGQLSTITDARERIELVQGLDDLESVREYQEAGKSLEKAEKGMEELKALHHEIYTHWSGKEQRVFGELIWAPPITLSTEPGQYTLDLAVIKIYPGKLDAKNYLSNTINIGKTPSRQAFMDKIYLDGASPSSFKFPPNRLVKLQGQMPESALFKQPLAMKDANGEPCLVVFKNGARTGTTIGKANNVCSYTRNPFVGHSGYYESRKWPVIPTDEGSGAFSAGGDSGSCVADAYSRVGGILTGGAGATPSTDVTYVTPISFIMKVLHDTKRFKRAHLNPALG